MKYYVPDSMVPEEAVTLSPEPFDEDYGATQAAEHYHRNGGWEASWPVEFVLLSDDGVELGRYIVERESKPVFYAYPGKRTT